MKTPGLLLTLLLGIMAVGVHAEKKSNIAYQDGEVRFTVITDGVIRLEWQPEGAFTDAPSQVAVCREYPQTDYRVDKSKNRVDIYTPKMHLTYIIGTGKFTAHNLEIRSADTSFPFVWKPGMVQQENLKGTFRTLDGLEGQTQTQTWVADLKCGEERSFEDGLLARDGWTLIDESQSYLFDDSEWQWVTERPAGKCQDWYFMAYGHDYKSALRDFTLFAGRVPLPPRFAFGYWWSRYWCYSDKELRQLVRDFQNYDFPLDVLVVDMDWHYTDRGRGGWTGWTWNESLFPDWRKMLKDFHSKHLKMTINLHPADGFESYEEKYVEMAEAMGVDPASKERIPWVNSDKRLIESVMNNVLHPMLDGGIDFWWIDWQQDMFDPAKKRLNNTWWINYAFFTDMERHGNVRPMLYHRWGGLGNHRYQIGFSGDVIISWKSLEFQPYFTATASNVLYGYWSHDIGGHMIHGSEFEPELYTRWLQFGGLSPIMRTHSSKDGRLNKEPWVFSHDVCDILRRTVKQRYQMVPYIYTMARKDYEEGISLCRPLYYDSPECQEAYDYRTEYMFGDEILVAPVVSPMTDGYAEVEVWLPEGSWYELHTGTMLDGGTHKRRFALDEYGIYIKAGAVLPFYGEEVKHLDSCDEAITVTVIPGGDGEFSLYEDAGNDKQYATNYATTQLTNRTEGDCQTITIGKREGAYEGMPAQRTYSVKVLASAMPESVTVNGQAVEPEYLGEEFALLVEIPETACDVEKTIRITYPEGTTTLTDGIIGKAHRLGKAITAFKYRTGKDPIDALAQLGSINEAATYRPERLCALVAAFGDNYRNLPEILKQQGLNDEQSSWFLSTIDWNAAE